MLIFLKKLLGLVALVALSEPALTGAALAADEAKPAAAKVTYDEHVRPIFREHCLSCHNPDAKKGDLSLDSYAGLRKGGSTGEVVEPGDADSSRMWALVTHADEPKMPPNQDKLPEAKLQIIKAWLMGGALENSGSVANVAKKPSIDLSVGAGAAKPSGPAAMPEGLFRQPVIAKVQP
jgi:mono/diheme cytochrome c family protein